MVKTCLVIVLLTIFYYMPDIFGGERDPDCTMKTAYSNAMFGWVLLGT